MIEMYISESSRDWIDVLKKGGVLALPATHQQGNDLVALRADIVAWLATVDTADQANRFPLESLRASLLRDLRESIAPLSGAAVSKSQEEEFNDSLNYLKYGLLVFAGTIFSVFEGYDYITSMLSLVSWIPSLFVFSAGIGFSLLSIVLFYGFDLVEISKNLNVKLSKSPLILDVFLEQLDEISAIHDLLNRDASAHSLQEWRALLDIVVMLKKRHNALDSVRETYLRGLEDIFLNRLKLAAAIFSGVILFGSGFFASQSLALSIVNIFMVSATATSLPVVLICSLIGLAAFGVYWYVQRPGLENLVGKWLGFDSDDIHTLADPIKVAQQKADFEISAKKIQSKIDDKLEIDGLRQRLDIMTPKPQLAPMPGFKRSMSVDRFFGRYADAVSHVAAVAVSSVAADMTVTASSVFEM